MVSGLTRRITQFRYLGYALLGVGLLTCSHQIASLWPLIVLPSIGWPICLHLATRAAHRHVDGPRVLQGVENCGSLFVAALVQFPEMPMLALLVSLLSGNLAQGGIRRLPEALGLVIIGWVAGDWARTQLGLEFTLHPTDLSNMIGGAHILLFTSLISAVGYERSLRMHRSRADLRAESKSLQAFSTRVAKFVDPGLSKRLRNDDVQERPLSRTWMTACFVDLVGFTQMSTRMAPESVCETVNLFLASISRLALKSGGRMDKFLGDGVLITFGDTEGIVREGMSRQHPADQMLEFCASVPKAMVAVNRELDKRALALSLEVRMGAASGYCTVGAFGGGERLDYTVIGPAVNLASRLEALAPVGCVLIDETTHKLASDAWPRSHFGAREIRGLSEAVDVWRMTPS